MKKNVTSSINSQTAFNIASLVLVNGLSFIITPYISKLLGTEGYGVCSLYITYVSIISIICGCKISSSLYTAKVKYEDSFGEYCASTFILGLLTSAAVILVVLLFKNHISSWIEIDKKYVPLIAIQGVAGYIIVFMTSYQTNNKKAELNLLLSFSVMFATTVLSIILIKMKHGSYEGRIYGLAFPNIIIALICTFLLLKDNAPAYVSEYWKHSILFGLPIVFQELAGVILNQADRVMLYKMNSFSATGIYSLGVTFAHITAVIYQAFNRSWVPFYYEDVYRENRARIISRVKSYMFNITLIAAGFLMASKEVYLLYAPADYRGGIDIVPILALGCYFQFLYFFPVNHELYKGKTIFVAIGTITAGIVNIILNWVLIPPYGMVGACIATAISNIALFIFHSIITRYLYSSDYYISTKMFIQCIVTVSLTYGLYYLSINKALIRWSIAGLCSIIFVARAVKRKGFF